MLRDLKQFNLPEIEEKVLEFWKENNIFEKSLEKTKNEKQFVFYEGPPTANGRPGIHHVLARVFKDIICRYKTMQGCFVPRRAGWDTQGLPVEIEVEKQLGIKNKQEIEKFGIAEFNKKAKDSVWTYKNEWEKLTERIGFWLDFKNAYITYENQYLEKLWGIFKKIHERGLLYKGHKVVPWCSRCGTALSSHELAQGYKEVTDNSVYVKFKLLPGQKFGNYFITDDKTYILSWTTTPWTLPGNVALAVGEEINYVVYKSNVLASSFITEAGGKLLESNYPAPGIYIFAKDATGVGKIMMEMADREDLKNTITIIKGKDLISLEYEPLFEVTSLKSEKSYKIYAADFVTTTDGTGVVHIAVMYGEDDYNLGKKISLPQQHTVDKQGKFIAEVPEVAGLKAKDKRMEEKIFEYLRAKNYLLKTESYTHDYPYCWRCGTPILYYANNSWFIKMSKLRSELLTENQKINWIPNYLKEGRFGEWLKDIKDWAISRERYWGTPLPIWECEKCDHKLVIGGLEDLRKIGVDIPEDLHRPYIDEVKFKCLKCKEGLMTRVKEVADVWFDSGAMPFATGEYPDRYPADYICEAIDQTRGWFYTLLAIGVLMETGMPYKNVISLGHVLDKQGQKMSKSKGNVIDPWDLINKYGVDVVRWYFYTINPPAEPKKFDETDLVKTKNKFHGLLYNSFVFYNTYSKSEILNPKSEILNTLDRWILARLNETTSLVTEKLDRYDIGGAAKEIEFLVDDLSRWYIRRSRKRPEALPVLAKVLLKISKLIGPFNPFFAESLYLSLKKLGVRTSEDEAIYDSSVHLTSWPKVIEEEIDENLVEQMTEVRRLASLVLAKRAEAGIKVRQPLNSLKVRSLKFKSDNELLKILADEINVQKIIFDEKLERELELDITITPELKSEGLRRELVRMIQDLRHDAGYQPGQLVNLFLELTADLKKVIEANSDFKKEVSIGEIKFSREGQFDLKKEGELDGHKIWMAVAKITSS